MKVDRVIVLGAGASKAYSQSPTGQLMPVAGDFFQTYNRLDISSNLWVLVGFIVNYFEHYHGIPSYRFGELTENIEAVHTEMEERLLAAREADDFDNIHRAWSAYVQLHFLFASVLNEIQNGPISTSHALLSNLLRRNDCVITFNWDCLLDRALDTQGSWQPGSGYFAIPKAIYDDGWMSPLPSETISAPFLLKLHGSANWLTSYLILDEKNLPSFTHDTQPDMFYVFRSATAPYSCYDGRYMSAYQPYSYGYYPPNIPAPGKAAPEGHVIASTILRTPFTPKGQYDSKGLVSMPLIIPPVRKKTYTLFGRLFKDLWEKAENVLAEADEIHIYGYSFPPTDTQAHQLFERAFLRRKSPPKVVIVNPSPDEIYYRFNHLLGVPYSKIDVLKEYIKESFDYNRLL
jgi:hypothetical protein